MVGTTNKSMLRIGAVIAAALWFAALFFPVFRVELGDQGGIYDGVEVLAMGFFGVLAGAFSWYANPYWIYATVRMALGRAPGPIGVTLNSLLAMSFVGGIDLFGSSEGVSGPAIPQVGAWLWLLSFAPGLIAGLGMAIRRSRRAAEAPGLDPNVSPPA